MFKKLGKVFMAATLSLGLVACAPKEEAEVIEPVSILCPTGAPALATLGVYDQEDVTIDYVEGADVLTAELSKEDGEYDIIVAPTNLGAKLFGQNQTYNLEAVVTWGNLYLVGEEGTDVTSSETSIAAFGEAAVPGLVFKNVAKEANLSENVTFYGSVQEAQQNLLANKADVALLAQPVAAATIAKGKEMDKNLAVLMNLQQVWADKITQSDVVGYPQASIFVKKDANVQRVLDSVAAFIENAGDEEALVEAIDAVGVETLGLPNAQIAAKTWNAQGIRYTSGKDAKDSIESFLAIFNIQLPEGLIVE